MAVHWRALHKPECSIDERTVLVECPVCEEQSVTFVFIAYAAGPWGPEEYDSECIQKCACKWPTDSKYGYCDTEIELSERHFYAVNDLYEECRNGTYEI